MLQSYLKVHGWVEKRNSVISLTEKKYNSMSSYSTRQQRIHTGDVHLSRSTHKEKLALEFTSS